MNEKSSFFTSNVLEEHSSSLDHGKNPSIFETGMTNNDISRFTINNKRNQSSIKIDFLAYKSKQSDNIVNRKIVFLGNSGVGKSQIIRSLINGENQQDMSISQTIGAEMFIKDISMTHKNKG
jgi:DNA replication protein DnaC